MGKIPTSKEFSVFAREVKKQSKAAIAQCNKVSDKKFKALCKAILAVFENIETGKHSFKFDIEKNTSAFMKDKGSAKSRADCRASFIKNIQKMIEAYSKDIHSGKEPAHEAEALAVNTINKFIAKFNGGQNETYETALNTLSTIISNQESEALAS